MKANGDCDAIDLTRSRKIWKKKEIDVKIRDDLLKKFLEFNDEELIYSCILAGCDYLPSIIGIGIRTSIKWLSRFKGKPNAIERVIRRLQVIFLKILKLIENN